MVAAKLAGQGYLNVFVEIIGVAATYVGVGTGQYPLVKMARQAAIRPSQAVEGEVVTPFVPGGQVHGSLNRVGGDVYVQRQSSFAYPRQMIFTSDQAGDRAG